MAFRPYTYDSLNPLLDAAQPANPLVQATTAPNPLIGAASSAGNPLTGALRAHPRPEIDRELLDSSGMLIPHARTFQALYNTFNKVYSYRWDEAVNHGLENAAAMRNDTYFRALLGERLGPLGLWDWDVKPDRDPLNPKAPHSEDQLKVARMLKAEAAACPNLMKFRRHLGWCAWFGRSANQLLIRKNPEAGLLWNPYVVTGWEPVDGDKLQYAWGDDDNPDGPGHWCVFINPGDRNRFPDGETILTDRTTALRLRRRDYRERFVVSVHEIEDAPYEDFTAAGRAKGIGLRDFVYWGWWLADEILSWLVNLAEKAGTLGILIFKYPSGNVEAKLQAEENAKAINNRNALAVPVMPNTRSDDYGVDVVSLPMNGLQFISDLVFRVFEDRFERLFVGQKMSSGGGNGGLEGDGRAEFAEDTKFALLRFDALGQEESLTTDYIRVLKRLNHPDAPGVYRWKYLLPDPKAKEKLESITKAASLPGKKMSFKTDDMHELIGTQKPEPGDDIVGGDDPQPGMGPGGPVPPGGNPLIPGGGNGGASGGGVPAGDAGGSGGGAGLADVAGSPVGAAETSPTAAGPGGSGNGLGGGGDDSANDPEQQRGSPVQPAGGRGAGAEGGVRSERTSGEGQPGPVVPVELVAAIAEAGERGDLDAADRLAQLASDPDGLAGLLEDLADGHSPQGHPPEESPNRAPDDQMAGSAEDQVRGLFSAINAALNDPRGTLAYEQSTPPWPGAVFDRQAHRWKVPGESTRTEPGQVRSERTSEPDTSDRPSEEEDVQGALQAHPLHAADPETARSIVERVKRVREAVWGWAVRATPAAWDLLQSVVDTPNDWKKFGYEPTVAGAGGATADPIRQSTGIGTHLALTVVSKVLASAVGWAKKHRQQTPPETYTADGLILPYFWSQDQTKTGKLKAVGSGELSGRVLYGEQARKALENQGRRGTQDDPAEQRKAAKVEARSQVGAAINDPTRLNPTQLQGLVAHMRTLTKPELKDLCRQVKAKVGGVKADVVDRLLAYVHAGRAGQPRPGGALAADQSPERREDQPDRQVRSERTPEVELNHTDAAHPVAKSIAADAESRRVLDTFVAEFGPRSVLAADYNRRYEEYSNASHAANMAEIAYLKAVKNKRTGRFQEKLRVESDRLLAEANRLEVLATATREARNNLAEDGRKRLAELMSPENPPTFRFTARDQSAPAHPRQQQVIDDSHAFVSSVADWAGEQSYQLAESGTGRAYYYSGSDTIATGTGYANVAKTPGEVQGSQDYFARNATETHIHEIGHFLEERKPGVKEKVKAFLDYRVGSETAVDLKQEFPGSAYDPGEMGRKDEFDKVWEGSSAFYVGKDYGGSYTEVVSMGLEQLYRDPVRFATKDPEFFTFMVGILRGDSNDRSSSSGRGSGGGASGVGSVGTGPGNTGGGANGGTPQRDQPSGPGLGGGGSPVAAGGDGTQPGGGAAGADGGTGSADPATAGRGSELKPSDPHAGNPLVGALQAHPASTSLADRFQEARSRSASGLSTADVESLLSEARKLPAKQAVELALSVTGAKNPSKSDAILDLQAYLTERGELTRSQQY